MPGLSAVAVPANGPDLRSLFTDEVRTAAASIPPTTRGLHEAELAVVARAVPKRRHEFAIGRALARELLAELGWSNFTLLPDVDRAPRWPAGAVGSISHSSGLCVAAVARAGAIASLGIDVEDASAVRRELWPRVLQPSELRWLEALAEPDVDAVAAVLFSAKEAVYKAQFPLRGARLGFHDVSLTLDVARGEFRAYTPGFARVLAGRFRIEPPWVFSGLAISAAEARA